MNLVTALLLDLGTYAAAMATFAAIVCYRANPLRSINRLGAALFANIAIWQMLVALARTSLHPETWGPPTLICGVFMPFVVFLCHDACVDPYLRIRTALRRNRLAWLMGATYMLGALLGRAEVLHPGQYPFWMRAVVAVLFVLGFAQLSRQRRQAQAANAHELLLFYVTTVHIMVVAVIYTLDRSPLSSRINTLATVIYLAVVIGLMLSERIFEAGSTSKLASGYILRCLVQLTLLLPVLYAYHTLAGPAHDDTWVLAVLIALLIYPIGIVSGWVVNRLAQSFIARPEPTLREAAMEALGSGESERGLLVRIEKLAKAYLGGIDVSVNVIDCTRADDDHGDPRHFLVAHTKNAWLSPDSAARVCSAAELEPLLRAFTESRLGAVVKYPGRKVVVALFVAERRGGTQPITRRELEFLHELAMIAGTGVDRLRAVDDSFRAQGLAMVGRLAADFSHSARNQISAIQALVEAVKDGQEAQLSPEYREAVYEETLALAANHNMALEITRLQPGKLTIKNVALRPFLHSVHAAYGRMAEKAQGRLDIEISEPQLEIQSDERLLRQVLLNLFRNSVQACAAAHITPVVTVRAWPEGERVFIDVIDNGPGVPEELYDRLFTPWATTKPDGTGLGLSFCLQAMRSLGGQISYQQPRGAAHGWFRLEALPVAPARARPVATPVA